jgi:phage shock protein A
VKNITVSVDDETYRRARIKAAERDTSVSGLVKRFLTELAAGESNAEQLKRQERALRERIVAFRAGDRLSRDDVHRRDG